MELTRQQKKLRKTFRTLTQLASFFESAGYENIMEKLDRAAMSVEEVAWDLEAIGLPKDAIY